MLEKVLFAVDLKGDLTGKSYIGNFVVKTMTSFRDSLREDEIRRSVLGVNPQNAGPYAASVAAAIAYLDIRVIDCPEWWTQSGRGLDLKDDNILVEVNDKAVKAIDEELGKVKKLADEAKPILKERITEE